MLALLSAGEAAGAGAILLVIFGLGVAFAVICGNITQSKGHGFALGLILGLFLGILGLIICLVLQDQSHVFMPPTRRTGRAPTRQPRPRLAHREPAAKCGNCAAPVTRANAFCPSCGVEIGWPNEEAEPEMPIIMPHNPRYGTPTPNASGRSKRRRMR